MTNLLGLIFDGGLAVLLVITIGYCSRLSSRIRVLQDSRGELASMIAQFDQATARATASMSELQTVSKRITDALQLKIEKANFLADDLAFLIEKSSKLASQLEQAKTAAAMTLKSATESQAMQKTVAAGPAKPKPSVQQNSSRQSHADDLSSSAKSASSLEDLLNRLALPALSPTAAAVKPPQPKPHQPKALRTEAERDLLEALKSDR